jgi:hypothetical protein
MTDARRTVTARQRVLIGAADQGLSSAQNFLLLVLVARQVPTAALGSFTVATTMAVCVIGLAEACVSEPALLHAADREISQRAIAVRSSLTCSLIVGVVGAACAGLTGVLLGGSLGSLLVVLGGILPGLVLHDGCRIGALTLGRAGVLLALDAVWVTVWLAMLVLLRPSSAAAQLAVWGFTALVSAGLGVVLLRYDPRRPAQDVHYWRVELSDSAASLFNEYGVNTASVQSAGLGVAAVSTLADAGVLRGGVGLFGPLNVFVAAMRIVVTPEVIRLGGSQSPRGRRVLDWAAAFGLVTTVALVAFLWLLPNRAGAAVLGATWPAAHSIVLILGAGIALGSVTTRSAVGLRADRRLKTIARVRNVVGPTTVACLLVGAALDGYRGAAWGSLGAAAVGLFVYEMAFQLRRPPRFRQWPMVRAITARQAQLGMLIVLATAVATLLVLALRPDVGP